MADSPRVAADVEAVLSGDEFNADAAASALLTSNANSTDDVVRTLTEADDDTARAIRKCINVNHAVLTDRAARVLPVSATAPRDHPDHGTPLTNLIEADVAQAAALRMTADKLAASVAEMHASVEARHATARRLQATAHLMRALARLSRLAGHATREWRTSSTHGGRDNAKRHALAAAVRVAPAAREVETLFASQPDLAQVRLATLLRTDVDRVKAAILTAADDAMAGAMSASALPTAVASAVLQIWHSLGVLGTQLRRIRTEAVDELTDELRRQCSLISSSSNNNITGSGNARRGRDEGRGKTPTEQMAGVGGCSGNKWSNAQFWSSMDAFFEARVATKAKQMISLERLLARKRDAVSHLPLRHALDIASGGRNKRNGGVRASQSLLATPFWSHLMDAFGRRLAATAASAPAVKNCLELDFLRLRHLFVDSVGRIGRYCASTDDDDAQSSDIETAVWLRLASSAVLQQYEQAYLSRCLAHIIGIVSELFGVDGGDQTKEAGAVLTDQNLHCILQCLEPQLDLLMSLEGRSSKAGAGEASSSSGDDDLSTWLDGLLMTSADERRADGGNATSKATSMNHQSGMFASAVGKNVAKVLSFIAAQCEAHLVSSDTADACQVVGLPTRAQFQNVDVSNWLFRLQQRIDKKVGGVVVAAGHVNSTEGQGGLAAVKTVMDVGVIGRVVADVILKQLCVAICATIDEIMLTGASAAFTVFEQAANLAEARLFLSRVAVDFVADFEARSLVAIHIHAPVCARLATLLFRTLGLALRRRSDVAQADDDAALAKLPSQFEAAVAPIRDGIEDAMLRRCVATLRAICEAVTSCRAEDSVAVCNGLVDALTANAASLHLSTAVHLTWFAVMSRHPPPEATAISSLVIDHPTPFATYSLWMDGHEEGERLRAVIAGLGRTRVTLRDDDGGQRRQHQLLDIVDATMERADAFAISPQTDRSRVSMWKL